MNNFIKLIVALTVPAFIMAGGMTSPVLAQAVSDMDLIKSANESYLTALSTRDMGAMEKVWSKETQVRYSGPRDKVAVVGWAATKNAIEATLEVFPELKVAAGATFIRVNGSTAWVNGIEVSQRKTKSGESQTGVNLVTNVFEKQNGRWLMVLHHASAIPQ